MAYWELWSFVSRHFCDCAIHPVSSAEGKAIWFSNTGSGTIAGERGDSLVLGCVPLLGFSLDFALGLF